MDKKNPSERGCDGHGGIAEVKNGTYPRINSKETPGWLMERNFSWNDQLRT